MQSLNISKNMAPVNPSVRYTIDIFFRPGIIFILFIILGAGIYFNSFDNPFHYDDYHNIVKNLNFRDTGNIPRYFIDPKLSTHDPHNSGHYRPIVVTSFAVNYAIGGLNTVGYHVVNLLIHTGSAFLIFLIVKTMLNSTPTLTLPRQGGGEKGAMGWFATPYLAALSAGLIFLVHPFNSEAVNYIIARSSLMSGFFYLLAFWCWVKFRQHSAESIGHRAKDSQLTTFNYPHYYIASLIAFIAGMLCKEVLITLPIVLWLYDIYGFSTVSSKQLAVNSKQLSGKSAHRSPLTANSPLNWRSYLPYTPFVLIVIIPYMLVRLFSLGKLVGEFQRDIITQLLTELPVLVDHWQMFFLPKGLSIYHDVLIYNGITGRLIYSGILLLIYIGIAVYLFMRRNTVSRVVSFFMFWFFIVLLPTIIIPLNTIFQENRGYLAIVSFVVVCGIILGELGRKRSFMLSSAILVVIITAGSIITIQRNTVWGDDLSLWKDAVEKAPQSVNAYAFLSKAYMELGDYFLSIETAQKGVSIDPDNINVRMYLAMGYNMTGNTDAAIEQYKKAISLAPHDAALWHDLSMLYIEKGDLKRARICIREGIKAWSTFPPLYNSLGLVYAKEGKLEEAVEAFNSAIRLNPSFIKAHYDLAETLKRLGKNAEAADRYAAIVRLGSGRERELSEEFWQDEKFVRDYVQRAKEKLDNRQ